MTIYGRFLAVISSSGEMSWLLQPTGHMLESIKTEVIIHQVYKIKMSCFVLLCPVLEQDKAERWPPQYTGPVPLPKWLGYFGYIIISMYSMVFRLLLLFSVRQLPFHPLYFHVANSTTKEKLCCACPNPSSLFCIDCDEVS